MKPFVDKTFSLFLKSKDVRDFDTLWRTEMDLVEEGNFRQAGAQSEVSRWGNYYVKKQRDYLTRLSKLFKFKPKAVCHREYNNIKAWQKMGIPTLEAVYFHQEPRAKRAILITKALNDYMPLDTWLTRNNDAKLRADVLKVVAQQLAAIHAKGWYHRCFFPKHVFVNKKTPTHIKIIDLEKARKQVKTSHRTVSEIAAFYRRCPWASPKEGLNFMKAYWGVNKFELKHRRLLKKLEEMLEKKKKLA